MMISRAPFTQAAFDDLHLGLDGDNADIDICHRLKYNCFCSKKRFWRLLVGYLPVIKFIRYYKVKEYAINDILAGLSVGAVHLPVALALGLLASVKVEDGLYASVWPALVYVFFGTSPHVSIGTSTVFCLLTATAVDREGIKWAATKPHIMAQVNNGTILDIIPEYLDFKEEVAMTLSLIVGVILIGMGLLRLGFITSYLSDSFFAAFTSAAAVHIGTAQLPAMLGIAAIPRFPGIFKLIKTYEAIFNVIKTANFATIIIAVICIGIILFVKDFVNERYKKHMFGPIPIDLLVAIFGTVASYFGNFRIKFGIQVIGNVPIGIPSPKIPTIGLSLASNLTMDAVIMAILSFAYTIAIAKILAKKHNYDVDDSQEMISYGLLHMISSFLRCFPTSGAPPRSMAASSMNVKTTLSGISSCILMFLVTMNLASLFKELPKAVLGAIIVASLKNLFVQIEDFYKYWRINKFDFFIWVCTFFATIFLDIDIGLYVGVGVSAVCVVFQTQFSRGFKLGYTKRDTTLVQHKKYKDSLEIPGVQIFRFQSNLYYANAEIFRNSLYRKTVNPRKMLKGLQKREKRLKGINDKRISKGLNPLADNNFIMTGEVEKNENDMSYPDMTLTDNGYPLSLLTAVNENVATIFRSSPELASLDSKYIVKHKTVDNHKNCLNDTKTKHLPDRCTSVFTINSTNSRFISDDSNINTDKERASTSLEKIGNMDSVVSLYSINFDDYIEDPDDGDEMFTDEKLKQMRTIHHVIIDCSPINYMDASGANVLTHIYSEYNHVNIELYLAGCCSGIRRTMRRAGVFSKIPERNFFVDVHDAVSYAKPQRPKPIRPESIRDFSDEEAIENSRAVNTV